MEHMIKTADDYGWTVFHYVAYNGIHEIIEDLVRVDKSVGYLVEKECKATALHIAAYNNKALVLWELSNFYPDCWEALVQRTHSATDLEDNSSLLRVLERDKMTAHAFKKKESLTGKTDVKQIEGLRRAANTHMIVAALITTVALTAGFAMPDGFDGNQGPSQGSPILLKKTTFKIFMATDAIALLCSLSSLFLYFIGIWFQDAYKAGVNIVEK
ncbi:hypothetical protein AgCh_019348 [Apium graveolens]